ncbi:MAG TPA: hypothetical protein VFK50_02150 [Sphingomicrobium sp.]|nr:hypothetical protein [Sphingomicrobium sp.]
MAIGSAAVAANRKSNLGGARITLNSSNSAAGGRFMKLYADADQYNG